MGRLSWPRVVAIAETGDLLSTAFHLHVNSSPAYGWLDSLTNFGARFTEGVKSLWPLHVPDICSFLSENYLFEVVF